MDLIVLFGYKQVEKSSWEIRQQIIQKYTQKASFVCFEQTCGDGGGVQQILPCFHYVIRLEKI